MTKRSWLYSKHLCTWQAYCKDFQHDNQMRVNYRLLNLKVLDEPIVTTSSSLILDARRFPVIVKTLDFDSLIGSLFESAQWRISSAEIFSESLSSGKLLKWADAATATRLHQIRRRPFAEVFHPFHYTQHCCIFSKTIANWHAASPMDSCHGNPSPSDPMESVTDIFHPFHYSTLLYVF